MLMMLTVTVLPHLPSSSRQAPRHRPTVPSGAYHLTIGITNHHHQHRHIIANHHHALHHRIIIISIITSPPYIPLIIQQYTGSPGTVTLTPVTSPRRPHTTDMGIKRASACSAASVISAHCARVQTAIDNQQHYTTMHRTKHLGSAITDTLPIVTAIVHHYVRLIAHCTS